MKKDIWISAFNQLPQVGRLVEVYVACQDHRDVATLTKDHQWEFGEMTLPKTAVAKWRELSTERQPLKSSSRIFRR